MGPEMIGRGPKLKWGQIRELMIKLKAIGILSSGLCCTTNLNYFASLRLSSEKEGWYNVKLIVARTRITDVLLGLNARGPRKHYRASSELQKDLLYGSTVLSNKKWTNNRIEPLSINDLLREHYKMGLAKSWTINQIEPLSGDPFSGFDCTVICQPYS